MCAATLLLAVLAGAPAPASAQNGTTRPLVTEVRFQGNETFASDSLASAIVTRQTRCRSALFLPFCWFDADFAVERSFLPRQELPRDRLRLQIWYQRRGFREATVDTAMSDREEGVGVTFRIDEGRPVLVDSIAYVGAEEIVESEVLEGLPLQEGDRLSTLLLDASRDSLTQRLANRGYAQAQVLRSWFIPSDDPYSAVVTYDVAPGPRSRYGHISVSGNEELSEGTVLRMLQFRSGDLYRANQLVEAQGRLFGLEVIRSASVSPRLDEADDGVVPVDVTVREGDVHRVRTGVGWTSSECFDADARWTSRNFGGGGRRLQLRGRVSNVGTSQFGDLLCWDSGSGDFGHLNWLASAELRQPWIFSTRNSLQASLYGERQSLPGAFIREALGLDLRLTRAIGPRTPLTLSYQPELSRLDAAEILFCVSFLICTPGDVAILQGANWLAPMGVNFTRNVTDNVLNPSRGYAVSLDLEHAASWTASNFRYDRAILEGSAYRRLDGTVLAAGARLGWVGSGGFDELVRPDRDDGVEIVHPQKRFFAGGANSVRGFAQNRLGPRVLTVDPSELLVAGCAPEEIRSLSCDASAVSESGLLPRPTGGTRLVEGSVELRIPVGSTFQAAVFTDFGQLWEADLGDRSLEVTPGAGLRYLSPIGPLRLDVAYRFRGGEELSVVTTQVVRYDPAVHQPGDRFQVEGETIPWVRGDQLAILEPRVFFGESSAWSLQRFQLHLSIGQAF